MDSNAPPKRKWFQFHLSTGLVTMFAAALELGANIQPKLTIFAAMNWAAPNRGLFKYYGWPFSNFRDPEDLVPLTLNVIFCLAVVATVGVFCEVWVRQRNRFLISKPAIVVSLLTLTLWLSANCRTYYTTRSSVAKNMGFNLATDDAPISGSQPWPSRGWPFLHEADITEPGQTITYMDFRLAGSEGYLANCTFLFLLLFWSNVFMHFLLRRPETALKQSTEGFTIAPSQEPDSR